MIFTPKSADVHIWRTPLVRKMSALDNSPDCERYLWTAPKVKGNLVTHLISFYWFFYRLLLIPFCCGQSCFENHRVFNLFLYIPCLWNCMVSPSIV